jgi:hypothetical protein
MRYRLIDTGYPIEFISAMQARPPQRLNLMQERDATTKSRRTSTGGDPKMPEKSTVQKAKEDLHEGKSPSTAAGEFVHEEIKHVREGKHGARSPQQAIAIGLSKARRGGVPLKPPHSSASRSALSRQTRGAARRRSHASRSRAARRAASTRWRRAGRRHRRSR